MKKLLIGLSVMLLTTFLLSSCGWFYTTVDDASGDITDALDTTDMTTPDLTDDTDTTAPDTTDTPDTSDTADTTEPDTTDFELTLPTEADWEKLGFNIRDGMWRSSYEAVNALLVGDIDTFANCCSVPANVYDSLRGIVISDYTLSSEEIVYYGSANLYPILEITVAESNSEFLPVGVHKLVFDEGLYLQFFKYEDFPPKNDDFSFARSYINELGSDCDFYPIQGEGRRQFGLCDFIVSRLNAIAGDYEPRSEAEIRAYAEKYLGVDGDTLIIEGTLEKYDGGYQLIGRGGAMYQFTVLSEEVVDGVNIVTVQFFADYSRTVTSRTVEFHMEMLDGEYRPIKTVILEDSEYKTVYFST